ncbi:pyridoxamine 5'-phosphate oxidase family protein [Occultella gossypii]|uniref:Pyridoxamine 5'-phosphate oxidase family protein n=1 Tax=Occultella gossypii TaxID=2800820 RepID=A0ABS7S9X6_9MICO|nr:pyridoxamine 5'-phosphate oxidase family protein [Occultella gossypii]MBZ2197148.1 pyridoxamine 5'-phosphate oxidase family protein [Occultella gossypii]
MSMPQAERQEFLAQPHTGALAVSAGPDRGPLVVPVWYGYESGGRVVWVVTPADSVKSRLIEAAGRFSLLAEESSPRVRYVSVEGPVVESRAATEDEHLAMARRYLGDGAAAYVEMAAGFGVQLLVRMEPQRWYSADLGPS